MTHDNGMDVSPSWQDLKAENEELRKIIAQLGAENRELIVERDALAAHVERLEDVIERSTLADTPAAESALDDSPTTSLARLVAEKQAEALELFASGIRAENDEGATADLYGMASLMEVSAAQFRRQASGDDS